MFNWLSSVSDWMTAWNRILPLLLSSLFSTMQVGPSHGGFLVTTNQFLLPSGSRTEFAGSPTDLALSPDGGTLAISTANTVVLYTATGHLLRTLALPGNTTYGGLVFSGDGQSLAVSTAAGVSIVGIAVGASLRTVAVPDYIPCGLAYDPVRPYLYVALNSTNRVARIDLRLMEVDSALAVGVAPVALAIAPDGSRLFVSNWGGRTPAAGDLTALSAGTPVVVDSRGIASSGTVSAIALDSFRVLEQIPVGLHPGGIRMSPNGDLLAVANANSDSISFIDPVKLVITGATALPATPSDFVGSSPTNLIFNAAASRLYVTCAGNNSVVTLVANDGLYELAGSTPTDWYPTAIAVQSDARGDTIFVANAKGVGSRAGSPPYSVYSRLGSWGRFRPADSRGLLSILNDPFSRTPVPRGSPAGLKTLGIHHVFLIIKENRTYDQVLGDLGRGNGDSGLSIYGAQVTPNHHQLAMQFGTLDNFYATGVVSAEGHQWITQAMATDYIERSYVAGWVRSYPYTGDDPLAFSPAGFLWDNAILNGLTVRIFGEFTKPDSSYSHSWIEYLVDAQSPHMQYATPSQSPVAPVNAIIEPEYPAFALNVPDQFRARVFLNKFQQYSTSGAMPNLVIVWLPSDHTNGTSPGTPAPASMVADNDLALGQIVQAISASPYWSSSAIFVTEDDAQNGVDHVDGHRTLCLVASPYARRGVVDSTSYNQTSIVRTIEDLLGLPPMTKFDAAALPMRSVFTTVPDLTPYLASSNLTPLARLSPPVNLLKGAERKAALASMKMDFTQPDAAPEDQLNRILWHAAKGWNKPYPRIPHRPDCKVDDDH